MRALEHLIWRKTQLIPVPFWKWLLMSVIWISIFSNHTAYFFAGHRQQNSQNSTSHNWIHYSSLSMCANSDNAAAWHTVSSLITRPTGELLPSHDKKYIELESLAQNRFPAQGWPFYTSELHSKPHSIGRGSRWVCSCCGWGKMWLFRQCRWSESQIFMAPSLLQDLVPSPSVIEKKLLYHQYKLVIFDPIKNRHWGVWFLSGAIIIAHCELF